MIKFKKILQKASAQTGHAIGVAMLAPEPVERRPSTAFEPFESAAASVVVDAPEAPRERIMEAEAAQVEPTLFDAAPTEATIAEDAAVAEPAAESPAPETAAESVAEPAADTSSVSDDIAADILRELSIDTKAFDAMKIAEAAEDAPAEDPLAAIPPEDLPEMPNVEGAGRQSTDSSDRGGSREEDTTATADEIGRLIDNVLSGVSPQQPEEKRPAKTDAKPIAAAGQAEGALGMEFMAEVDRLLSEFGQVTAADVPQSAPADPADENNKSGEGAPDMSDALSEAEREALAAISEAANTAEGMAADVAKAAAAKAARDKAKAAKASENQQGRAQKATQAREQNKLKNDKAQADADEKMADKADSRKSRAADEKPSHAPEKPAAKAKEAKAGGKAAPRKREETADMDTSGETLTNEEKEALTADEGEAGEASDAADAVTREIDDVFADKVSQLADADANELVLDFTASSVGIEPKEKEEDNAAGEGLFDTSDLLSKVLADLDKLGPVEKPKEAAPAKEESMDFTQILADEPVQEKPARAAKPSAPAAPAEVEPPREEPQEAARPSRQAPPKREETNKRTAPAPEPAPAEEPETAAEDALAREIIEETIDERPSEEDDPDDDDSDDDSGDEDGSDESFAPFNDAEGGNAGSAEAAAEKIDSIDEDEVGDAAGPAAAESSESDVEASFEASVDATEKVQEVQRRRSGEPIPEEEISEEERIRDEVLSRTKEVDQKVLDEVFGADKEKFRSQVKAEIAQDAKGKTAVRTQSAMSKEGERRKSAGTDVERSTAPAPEWQPTVFEALYERIGGALVWLAFQINRPFERWLNPARRQVLAIVSVCFIMTSVVLLIAASAMRIMGR